MPCHSIREKTLDGYNYHLQLDVASSFLQHVLVESSYDDSDADMDGDFLFRSSFKVVSSV
jgi:hypothetical protein